MRVEGRRTLVANPEIIWSLLTDPATLGRILPGCRSLEAVASDEYRLTLETRIGQTVERLIGTLRYDRMTLHRGFDFSAESGSGSGALLARGRVSLEPETGEQTTLVYEADIEAGGRFAEITPRLMQTTMNAIARRALEALEREAALRTRVFTTTTALPAAERMARSATAVDRLAHYRRWLIIGPVLLALALIVRGIDRRRTRAVARQAVARQAVARQAVARQAVARQVAEMLEHRLAEPQDPSPAAPSRSRA